MYLGVNVEGLEAYGPTPNSPAVTTHAVIQHLEQLKEAVVVEGGENASESQRDWKGLSVS